MTRWEISSGPSSGRVNWRCSRPSSMKLTERAVSSTSMKNLGRNRRVAKNISVEPSAAAISPPGSGPPSRQKKRPLTMSSTVPIIMKTLAKARLAVSGRNRKRTDSLRTAHRGSSCSRHSRSSIERKIEGAYIRAAFRGRVLNLPGFFALSIRWRYSSRPWPSPNRSARQPIYNRLHSAEKVGLVFVARDWTQIGSDVYARCPRGPQCPSPEVPEGTCERE